MDIRRAIHRLLLSLGATLVALAVVEGVVRLVRDPRPMEVSEQRHAFPAFYSLAEDGLFTRDRDGDLRYRLTPGFEAVLHDRRYTINSLGFRGEEPKVWGQPSVRRIVLLGDSYAFGLGVDQDQTLAKQLEKRVRATEPIEVLNLGVPGYQTGQELALAERFAFQLRPDLVVLLYFGNDQVEEAFHYDPAYRVLYGDALPIPYSIKGVLGRSAVYRWLALAHIQQLQEQGELSPMDNRDWPVTKDRIEGIARGCSDREVPFVVANLPMLWSSETLADPAWPGHSNYNRVGALATELGVPWVDLRATLLATSRGPNDDFLAPLVVSSEPPRDHHFNEAGYMLLADAITLTLQTQGLLGDSNPPHQTENDPRG